MTESVLSKDTARMVAVRLKEAYDEAVAAVYEARAEANSRRAIANDAKEAWQRADRVYRMLSGEWGKRKKAQEGAETPE